MIEAVFLHAPGDADLARRLVAHWPLGRAVAVDAAKGVAATGGDLLLCGLWTGAEFGFVEEALMTAPRRAVILEIAPAPPEVQRLGLLVIDAREDAAVVSRLAGIAEELRRGIYPTPSAPPAEAPRKRRARVKRERVAEAAPVRRSTSGVIDPEEEEQRRRRRRGAFGFAIGAGLGVAVFFGAAAPYIGTWLNRRDAPPPIVVAPRTAAAAPAIGVAPPPPPIEVTPSPDAAPPALPEEAPLRGLLDEETPS